MSLFMIMSACITLTVVGKWISSKIFMSINRNFHQKVISGLINTNMQFFDENTSGRIINRLSQDIKATDAIVFNFMEMIDYIVKCSFSVFFIMVSSPFTILVVIAQLGYFYYLRRRVIHTTRDCFRLKSLLNSPIVSMI